MPRIVLARCSSEAELRAETGNIRPSRSRANAIAWISKDRTLVSPRARSPLRDEAYVTESDYLLTIAASSHLQYTVTIRGALMPRPFARGDRFGAMASGASWRQAKRYRNP